MVDGLKRLNRKLSRLPAATRKRLQADINLRAREINVAQRAFVPIDDGILRGSIKNQEIGGDRIGNVITAGGSETTRPVRDGASVTFDYALAQEFGTQEHPPSPFFYGPYRAVRSRIRSSITRGLKRAIRDSVR